MRLGPRGIEGEVRVERDAMIRTCRRMPGHARAVFLTVAWAHACVSSRAVAHEPDEDLHPPRVRHAAPVPHPAGPDAPPARVVLEVSVDEQGRIQQAHVVSVELDGELRLVLVQAALTHIWDVELEPARRGEQPVPAVVAYEMAFGDPGAPPAPEPSGEGPVPEPAEEQPPRASPATEHEAVFEAVAEVDAEGAAKWAASDWTLRVEPLREVPRRRAEQMWTLSPGVVLGNHSGEGHAPTVFLRGFNAGEGQDVEVTVDGIPMNEPSNAHGHGYADVGFVPAELVREVRIVEGPFDPRQSDFAVAGSIDYRLGVDRRGVLALGEYGSFQSYRAVTLWAPEGGSPGTFVAAETRGSAGFGPNRSHRGFSVLGQYERARGPLEWSLLVATHALSFDSAGVVREDAVQARSMDACPDTRDDQFFCLHDPNQGGAASRHLVSGRIGWAEGRRRLDQRVFLMLRQNRFRENFTGRLLNPMGDGLDQQYGTVMAGARGSYRVTFDWLGRDHRVEAGYVARHDAGRTRAWRLRDDGIPHDVVFDKDIRITHAGVYALGEVSPLERYTVRAGLRVDHFAFSTVDRNAPETDRTGDRVGEQAMDAFGVAVQPRLTTQLRLVPGLHFIKSIGLGSRSSDAVALSEGERAPFARVRAFEAGLVYRGDLGPVAADLRAVAFHTHVNRDLLFDPERGRNVPLGASSRYGASLTGQVGLGRHLDARASLVWTEAHALPEDAGRFAIAAGPRLPFVPRMVSRIDAVGRHTVRVRDEPVRLALAGGLSWVGRRPLPFDALSEPIVTVDASATVGWRWLTVGLMALNLFDARYRQLELHHPSHFGEPGDPVSLRPARHFAAGPPLTVLLTVAVHIPTGPAPREEEP
jgi:iron complex outermembrane recepter protein